MAVPLATSAKFTSATACTERRWLRTLRRSRMAHREYPGPSSSTRALIVAVYGAVRPIMMLKSVRPKGRRDSRRHHVAMDAPGASWEVGTGFWGGLSWC
jgi:hypothetical protein